MFRWIGRLAVIALGCGALLAGGAATAAQNINLNMDSVVQPTGQQATDQKAVDEAWAAMRAGGFPAVEAHLGALREALAHAPASFPVIEQTGDQMIIRVDDPEDYMVLSLMAGAMAAKGDGSAKAPKSQVNVQRGVNTYPMAALMLGSYYDEVKRPQEALPYIERGLAIQPNNYGLIIEKGAAFILLRRFADAVALYDNALDGADIVLIGKQGLFLRNRGVALVELNRLDEAEKSLRDSIKANKGDKIGVARAKEELAYIKGLRKGGRATPIELQTRSQAQDAAAQAPPK